MTLTANDIQLVQSTFQRIRPQAEQAARLFYERLFELDPALRPMFRGDLTTQGRHLMAALTFVVEGLHRPAGILPTVRDLGRRHTGYGVTDAHYDTVGAALLWTLGQALGPDFTPAVQNAWAKAYTLIATEMKHAAHHAMPVGGLR